VWQAQVHSDDDDDDDDDVMFCCRTLLFTVVNVTCIQI